MARKPLSVSLFCAASALLGIGSASPASAQYYAAFPGATYAQRQLPHRGQEPFLFQDPRLADEREARLQMAGFWPEANPAPSYELWHWCGAEGF